MENTPEFLLSTLVIALIEVIKQTFPTLNIRYVPALTLCLSVVISYFIGVKLLDAITIGLIASGLYSQVKTTIGK